MSDPRQHWHELETSLAELVDELEAKIDSETISLLREYLDNREYGLTLECLYSAVQKDGIALTGQQDAKCHHLARLMGIAP